MPVTLDFAKKRQRKRKKPLFTLGSVHSTKASGAEQTSETNNSNLRYLQAWPGISVTVKQTQVAVKAGLEPGAAGL